MRVGPLGCLALLGAGSVGWAVGRLPEIIDGVRRDLASVAGDAVQTAVVATPIYRAPDAPMAAVPVEPARTAVTAIASAGAAMRADALLPVGRRSAEPPRTGGSPPVLERPPATEVQVLLAGTVSTERHAGLPAAAADGLSRVGSRPPPATGFALATAAYADLAAGDRRGAAGRFTAALAADPQAENAAAWRRALRQLTRQWSSEAYVIMRDGGPAGLGSTPVLGGGQGGRSVIWTPEPLARRPLYAVIRTSGGRTKGLRIDGESDNEQAAIGLRWQAAAGATISVERLFAVTGSGRAAWTIRLAGGGTRQIGPLIADAYAEAGVVGLGRGDLVGGLQARLFRATDTAGVRVEKGVGIWAGVQRTSTMIDRFDIGPTVSIVVDAARLRASLDYRFRIAGNAAPGSGPALTVSRSF